MSTLLKLKIREYDAMIATGAFEGLERRRIELIHGELREMSPVGPMHEDIISVLTEWSVKHKPQSVSIRVQCSIGLPELDSAPEPDLAWVVPPQYTKRRPEPADVLLVIEVARSSLAYDLGEKRSLYAQAGVPEYWVVDIAGRQIHIFRKPANQDYEESQVVTVGQTVAPLADPTALLDVRTLFAEEPG